MSIHPKTRPGPLMVIEEVAEILTKLFDEGKTKYVDVSNFTPRQFYWLQLHLDIPIVTNQVQASLLHTEPLFNGVFDLMQQNGIKPIIGSSLKGGALYKRKERKISPFGYVLNSLNLQKKLKNCRIEFLQFYM